MAKKSEHAELLEQAGELIIDGKLVTAEKPKTEPVAEPEKTKEDRTDD